MNILIVTEVNEILTIMDKDSGETYKVKPIEDYGNGCRICVFSGEEIYSHMLCSSTERLDNKSVYFEKIK